VARTQEFQNGAAKDQDLSSTLGTPNTVSSGYVPHSVDDQRVISDDGMAKGATGADRREPGMTRDETPPPNATALNTFTTETTNNTYKKWNGI